MKLYRAVSAEEYKKFKKQNRFWMGKNTLEGKQFFKEEAAVKEFVENAKQRNYQPPYQHVLVVQADEECMSRIGFCEQKLDGYDAITIRETYLNSFNRYIKFVEDYDV